MITREILEAQKALYVQGQKQAASDFNAFNGAIEAMNSLLAILTDMESAQAKLDEQVAETPEKESE